MLSFYIAASYPRKEEARALAALLVQLHFRNKARWLVMESIGYAQGIDKVSYELAEIDFADVIASDLFIQITGDNLSRGGRHTELGMALALGKPILILGPKEQVFHHHPNVRLFTDSEALVIGVTNYRSSVCR